MYLSVVLVYRPVNLSVLSDLHVDFSPTVYALQRLHDGDHFAHLEAPVVGHVVQLEGPLQFALFRLAGRNVDGHEELLEVEEVVAVGVEDSHHMLTKLVRVACVDQKTTVLNKMTCNFAYPN